MRLVEAELLGEMVPCVVVEPEETSGDITSFARSNGATRDIDGHEFVVMCYERVRRDADGEPVLWLDAPDVYSLEAVQSRFS